MTSRKNQPNGQSQFEPGACVASDAPRADTMPLETPPGTDHFAVVEARRIEMILEWDQKIKTLKARAADLNRQAVAKRGEVAKLAEANFDNRHYNKINSLQGEASGLEYDARHLLRIELPKLEVERTSVGGGTHPTLWALRIGAEGRVANDFVAKLKRIAVDLDAARAAFDQHLAAIATPETSRLAQALVDASAAANIKADFTVCALLASRNPKAAI